MVKNIEKMMTADREAVGIKAKWGLRKAQAIIKISPVITPPNGVLTPEVELTADLHRNCIYLTDPV